MQRGGRRDREVWDRYGADPTTVSILAEQIKQGAGAFPTTPEVDEDDVDEGRLLYRRHRARERSRSLVNKKKTRAREQTGGLACEVCGFDLEATYRDRGRDLIECHHLLPLAASGPTRTRLDDLALVCSNSHRMIHQSGPWPTIDEMRGLVAQQPSRPTS